MASLRVRTTRAIIALGRVRARFAVGSGGGGAALAPPLFSLLPQYRSLEASRSAANAFAVLPLARHARMRSAHFSCAVAKRTRKNRS